MRDQMCFKAVLKVFWCETKVLFQRWPKEAMSCACVCHVQGGWLVFIWSVINSGCSMLSLSWTDESMAWGGCPGLGRGSLLNLTRDQKVCSAHPLWWWDKMGWRVLPSFLMVRSKGMEGTSILSEGEIKGDGGNFHPLWWWDQRGWSRAYIHSDGEIKGCCSTLSLRWTDQAVAGGGVPCYFEAWSN